MKFAVCPRCLKKYFEKLKTYAFCHNCDFNSVEAYAWNDKERTIDRPVHHGPVLGMDAAESGRRTLKPIFTATDYSIVRQALLHLSEIERRIVLLRFWEKQDMQAIAVNLEVGVKKVERVLSRAIEKLRTACMRHPDFSRALSFLQAA